MNARASSLRVIEQGDVFFFYRPRVGVAEVHDLGDVQRFFLILRSDRKRRFRWIIVGRKRLPDPHAHEREWAFVADVTDDPTELRDALERQARPVGEGRYAIVDHEGHTHFAYVLELPREPGPAQRTFGILPEASYIVAVRNPKADAPAGVGLGPRQRAHYPPELLELFGNRRFVSLIDPRLLDFEGTELVLIGASDDVDAELGIELDRENERLENADIFRELRLPRDHVPTEPLERGELR